MTIAWTMASPVSVELMLNSRALLKRCGLTIMHASYYQLYCKLLHVSGRLGIIGVFAESEEVMGCNQPLQGCMEYLAVFDEQHHNCLGTVTSDLPADMLSDAVSLLCMNFDLASSVTFRSAEGLGISPTNLG